MAETIRECGHNQGGQPNWNSSTTKGTSKGKGKGGKGKTKGTGGKGNGSKGKGGNKGKGGGKGSNRAPVSDAIWGNWADSAPPTQWHPDGQKICRHFHTSSCRGGCGASHSHCPKMLASGRHCMENHRAQNCPHA